MSKLGPVPAFRVFRVFRILAYTKEAYGISYLFNMKLSDAKTFSYAQAYMLSTVKHNFKASFVNTAAGLKCGCGEEDRQAHLVIKYRNLTPNRGQYPKMQEINKPNRCFSKLIFLCLY